MAVGGRGKTCYNRTRTIPGPTWRLSRSVGQQLSCGHSRREEESGGKQRPIEAATMVSAAMELARPDGCACGRWRGCGTADDLRRTSRLGIVPDNRRGWLYALVRGSQLSWRSTMDRGSRDAERRVVDDFPRHISPGLFPRLGRVSAFFARGGGAPGSVDQESKAMRCELRRLACSSSLRCCSSGSQA